jgi:hypothetical protein
MDVPTPEPPSGEDAGPLGGRLQVAVQVVTLVVALSAIALSVWQGMEMRRHNRLSVIPKLEVGGIWGPGTSSLDGGPAYVDSVTIENAGLGPAVLHRVQARVEDSVVFDSQVPAHRDTAYVYRALQDSLRTYNRTARLINVRTYPSGQMLPTGTHPVFLVEVVLPDSLSPNNVFPVRRELRPLYQEHDFHFCYCSIYGEDCAVASLWADAPPDAFTCRPFADVP